jgi:hypothetical protein
MHQKTLPQGEPPPLLMFLPLIIVCVSALYWYVTSQLKRQEPRWYRASELKEDFPEIFNGKKGSIETLIYDNGSQLYAAKNIVYDDEHEYPDALLHDSVFQLYAAKDITDEGERWCVLTPVNLGKWKICNIWWLALSGLCVTLPLCTVVFTVHNRLFMSSNMAGSVAVLSRRQIATLTHL